MSQKGLLHARLHPAPPSITDTCHSALLKCPAFPSCAIDLEHSRLGRAGLKGSPSQISHLVGQTPREPEDYPKMQSSRWGEVVRNPDVGLKV